MANRIVQLLGQGFGAEPAQIAVTANGNTVFTGAIPTIDQPVAELPNRNITNDVVVLCSFEIDQSFTGTMPMTCQVTAGSVIFAEIYANYSSVPNPVYTQEQLTILWNPASIQTDCVAIYVQVANPALSQQDINILLDKTSTQEEKNAILAQHNCALTVSSGPDEFSSIYQADPRSSISINNIPQTPDYNEFNGTWWWTIGEGSTLSYLLNVDPEVL
jgi:hypothetical protein